MLHCPRGSLSTLKCSSFLAYSFRQPSFSCLFLLRKREALSSIAARIFHQTVIPANLPLLSVYSPLWNAMKSHH
jgi:hypothetical protein